MKTLSAVAIGILSLLSGNVVAQSTVRLCADQWMPYNGDPAETKPGYVIELAKTVFEPRGIAVAYEVVPWEDALAAVKECKHSGAIGANKEEAEGLTLPRESIGAVAVCLITRADSKWSYNNIASFRNGKLGIIKGYSYWPALDSYIEGHADKGNIVVAEGDDPLEDLMTKLQAGEIDVVAESEPILLWYLRSHDLDRANFKVVFKGTIDPIYVAFSPDADGQRYAGILDEGIRELRKSGELVKLLQRYGLRDWQ